MNTLFACVLGASLTVFQPAAAQDSQPAAGVESNNPELIVTVDPRVELMSIIFRLSGTREYNVGRVESYIKEIDTHFADHRGHPVVRYARALKRQSGVSYDAVMSMAVHLESIDPPAVRVPPAAEWRTLDSRWSPEHVQQFLNLARDFVERTDFVQFLADHRPLYDLTAARMETFLEAEADMQWFEKFFGTGSGTPFTVVLGLVNGPANYGPRFRQADGTEEMYAVIGVGKTDENGDPVFDTGIMGTLVHEFNHSFVNPLVAQQHDALRPAGEVIFPLVEDAMRRQAYGQWETMMAESVVRAAVIRYTLSHYGEERVAAELVEQKKRGFLWMEELVELLDDYESDRETYPTFESFMPRIVEYFNDLKDRAADLVNESSSGQDSGG